MKIIRKFVGNLDIVIVPSGDINKYFITANCFKGSSLHSLFCEIGDFLKSENCKIFSQLVFGDSELSAEFPGDSGHPVTWLNSKGSSGVVGTRLIAVSGAEVNHVMLDGVRVGSSYSDAYAEYCYIGNIHTDKIHLPRKEQAGSAYEMMLLALRSVGMDFSNVVRMWNYLDGLLEWYGEFNDMRTAFFRKHSVFENLIPGGTGIGAGNPAGAAYTGELLAVKPLSDDIAVSALPSPMQCPAIDYKSSFSRAVEIDTPDMRYISVSGTASIDPGGRSVHIGDSAGQIELTMQVVEALLKSRDMDWDDTLQLIAYFKDIDDMQLFTEYLVKNSYPPIPVTFAHSDICRDDLLFEVELEAAALL